MPPSSLHKSSGCILKELKYSHCQRWSKASAFTQELTKRRHPVLGQKSTVEINQHIQRHREIMGRELGPIQKQKRTVHENTHMYAQLLAGNKVYAWINIYFWSTHCSGHTVSGDQKHHNSPSVQPCHESQA